MADTGEDETIPPPDVFLPAVRCGVEMVLVGSIVALVGLPADTTVMTGFVVLVAVVAMLVVLFYCVNQQMATWIRRARKRPTMRDGDGLP